MEIKELVTVVPSSTDLVPVSIGEDTRNCKVSDLWDKELKTELEEARGTHDNLNSRLDADKTDALTREIESTGYGVISGLTVGAQATPNMTVSIATGIVHMPNGVRLAPSARAALTINAADTTNPRKDIIHVNSDSTIGYTPGIPSTTPVAPTVPVGAFLLAEITVGANVTTITNLNIADKRKLKNSTDSLATQLSDYTKVNSYLVDSGSANAYVITPSPAITSYVAGQVFKFKAVNSNTGASTLNVSGKGAIALVKDVNVPLVTGDILAGQIITAVYDSTNFQIVPDVSTKFSSHVSETVYEQLMGTRDLTVAGIQTFTLATNKIPKRIEIIATVGVPGTKLSNGSWSESGGVQQSNMFTWGGASSTSFATTSNLLYMSESAITNATKVDFHNRWAGGFDINWSKDGTGATGTATLLIKVSYHD